MIIERYQGNPILIPDPKLRWMSAMTMNPGLCFDGAVFHMLFTARGADTPLVLGYASSMNGRDFTVRNEPFMTPSAEGEGFDTKSCDDARIMKIGDTYRITYNARGAHAYRRVGLAETKDFVSVQRRGPLTAQYLSDANVVLFPEKIDGSFWVLHRPSPFQPHTEAIRRNPDFIFQIRIARTDDFLHWYDDRELARQTYYWENQKIGPAGEPVKTEKGWIMLYHGVYAGPDVHIRTYRVGAMLLDLKNPLRVIARTPEPIFEPMEHYEKVGNHDNVVFPCANPVIDGVMHIYYGAADTVIGLATVSIDELLKHLLQHPL